MQTREFPWVCSHGHGSEATCSPPHDDNATQTPNATRNPPPDHEQHAHKPVAQECEAWRYFSSTNANLRAPGRVPQTCWVGGTGPAKHLLGRHQACHRTRSKVRDQRFLWNKEPKHDDPRRRHTQPTKREARKKSKYELIEKQGQFNLGQWNSRENI